MARKKRRRAKQADPDEFDVSDGVRQSVAAIVLIALGVVLLLSFFKLAGNVGVTIDTWLARQLGIARVAVPFLFLAVGGNTMLKRGALMSARSFFCMIFFVLSLNGLLDLIFVRDPLDSVAIAKSGGALGMLIAGFLVGALGFWASLVVAFAVLLLSVVLLFNAPVSSLVTTPLRIIGIGRKRGGLDVAEGDEEVDEDDGLTFEERKKREEEEAEDAVEEEEIRSKQDRAALMFNSRDTGESVMTSKLHRTIEIPLDLLDDRSSDAKPGDVERNQEIISKTLAQFGIDVEMSDYRVGPAVTQYALRPAQGVRLAKIAALQNDLALALAAHPIRIEAPIPGKSLVGIEVPNQTIGRVCLRELLESKEFAHRKTSFTVPLGKDVGGATQLLAVEKAPHMLVAGATGSGKSVCLNDIIISLLYQNGPDDLKLILVDPKRVELGVYAGIPHLLVPPIVKVDEAINALKWAVREMERRLDYLAKFGAKDIESYNAKSKERMPRIIIIIDELADLMSQNKRDVEAVIVRIAQMARASGIHLIVATQRPSVDVITGIIKANIPTRLAFAVASQVDSKTILDTSGAEKLLGRGDGLMSTPDLSKPKRIQGAFVSEKEIERVVNFLKKDNPPDYNPHITEFASNSGGTAFNGSDADPLLNDAIDIAIEAGKVSTSYLQRRMKIGYSRAARIVDLMEELGVVGPGDGAKPREVRVESWPPKSGRGTQSNENPIADSSTIDEDEIDEVDIDVDDEEESDEDDVKDDEKE